MSNNLEDDYEDFDTVKESERAEKWAKYGIASFFVINALLTAIYGFAAVVTTFPPTQQPSFQMEAAVYVLATVFAGIIVILLDGSRFILNRAAIARSTSGTQQILARTGEGVMIFLSTMASVGALRVLFSIIGISTLTVVERENSGILLTWVLSAALVLDFVLGYFYLFLSPKAKAARSAARLKAVTMDEQSKNAEYIISQTAKKLPAELKKYQPQFIADSINRSLAQISKAHGQHNNAPRQAVAQEEPLHVNGTQPRQGRGQASDPN